MVVGVLAAALIFRPRMAALTLSARIAAGPGGVRTLGKDVGGDGGGIVIDNSLDEWRRQRKKRQEREARAQYPSTLSPAALGLPQGDLAKALGVSAQTSGVDDDAQSNVEWLRRLPTETRTVERMLGGQLWDLDEGEGGANEDLEGGASGDHGLFAFAPSEALVSRGAMGNGNVLSSPASRLVPPRPSPPPPRPAVEWASALLLLNDARSQNDARRDDSATRGEWIMSGSAQRGTGVKPGSHAEEVDMMLGYERFTAKHELMLGGEAGKMLEAMDLLAMGEDALDLEDDVSDVEEA